MVKDKLKGKFKFKCNPNPKQKMFFKAKRKYIAYGGARAGGKSWAMRVKFVLLALKYSNFKILLLRRTYPELEANHIIPLQLMLKGIANYVASKRAFYFPNGSILKLGYCKTDADAIQYHGHEYDVIGFEEATLFTEWQLTFIATCARNVRTDFMPRLYYTCNPGGVGHAYIKRLFIDREYENEENPDDYEFIPALIYDNEILMRNDPTYMKILNNLPEELRKAHRDGDWDALSGQYFKEFIRTIHVIEPFEIPKTWKRYVTIDYGLDKFAAYFIAVDYNKNCYVYKEIYEENLIISDAANLLKKMILPEENIKYIYGPPDLEARRQDTGKSALQIFLENDIIIVTTRNDRIPGWLCIKEMLKVREVKDEQTGQAYRTAQLKFFSNVKSLVKNLPMVQRDDKNPNDISKEPHELTHGPDALRYFCSKFLEAPTVTAEGIKGTWTYGELLMKGYTPAKIHKMRDSGQIRVI
jgi:phage terminase large subunit